MKEVVFIISKDGSKVQTEASGFMGTECRDVTKNVIDGLGQITSDEDKQGEGIQENIKTR